MVMAALVSTGSPTGKMSRKSTPSTVKVRDESDDGSGGVAHTLTVSSPAAGFTLLADTNSQTATNSHSTASHRNSYAILQSDKLGNVQPAKPKEKVSHFTFFLLLMCTFTIISNTFSDHQIL